MILSNNRQQKQLDEMSLDVESLKDEMDDYFAKLRDLDTMAAELKDDNKGSRRDREKLRRTDGANAERHECGDERA